MTWVWILLAAPVVGFVGWHFCIGFAKGWREGWNRPRRWRKLKGAWSLCERVNPDRNL